MNLLTEYYGTLIVDCIIIAIETIGLVKFLDNFIFPKRNLSLREKCAMEFVICVICAFINSTYIDDDVSDICNLFILALSLTQLAYDGIVHGVPKFLEKIFGVNNKENVEVDLTQTEIEGK